MSVENLIMEYSNMLFKICMVIMCNEQDAQDAIEEVTAHCEIPEQS